MRSIVVLALALGNLFGAWGCSSGETSAELFSGAGGAAAGTGGTEAGESEDGTGVAGGAGDVAADAGGEPDSSTCSAPAPFYLDADGDGYGAGTPVSACAAPGPQWTLKAGDCDDTDARAYPGAATYYPTPHGNPPTFDYDCNGVAEEAPGTEHFNGCVDDPVNPGCSTTPAGGYTLGLGVVSYCGITTYIKCETEYQYGYYICGSTFDSQHTPVLCR